MKPSLILATAIMLTMLSAATVFAAHDAKLPAAPLPAHGSIWFGDGLERFSGPQTRVNIPPHGSIWFDDGLEHVSSPHTGVIPQAKVSIPVHGSVWFGDGLTMLTAQAH